jgi:hypothetical protein
VVFIFCILLVEEFNFNFSFKLLFFLIFLGDVVKEEEE